MEKSVNPEKTVFQTAVYIRLSREDGDKDESDSVGNQRKLLMEYLSEQEELELYDFYVDDGCSGTTFDRPAFRRMLKDLKEKQANCVLVKDLSRFGRDYIHTGWYLERVFPDMEVRFIAVTDGIDSQKGAYDMLLPIKNIFNEQYARDISKKIRSAMRAKQKTGDFIGAFACYGYRKSKANRNRLVPDPGAAEVVRTIFRLYAEGMSRRRIAEFLNERRIPSPSEYKRQNGDNYIGRNSSKGGGWSYSSVYQILENEIYIGNMLQGKKRQELRGRQHAESKKNWIRVCNTHEAIIDRELWKKTRTIPDGIRKSKNMEASSGFSGFLRCGECKKPLVRNCWKLKNGQLQEVFYCGTYRRSGKSSCTPHAVPVSVLEKTVRADLRTFALYIGHHLSDICCEWDNRPDYTDTGKQERRRLEKLLDKTERLCRGVYEDYKDGLLTFEEFQTYLTDYRKRKKEYAGQIGRISENCAAKSKDAPSVLQMLRELEEGFFPEKLERGFLLEILDEITVFDENIIEINYFSEAFSHLDSGKSE